MAKEVRHQPSSKNGKSKNVVDNFALHKSNSNIPLFHNETFQLTKLTTLSNRNVAQRRLPTAAHNCGSCLVQYIKHSKGHCVQH